MNPTIQKLELDIMNKQLEMDNCKIELNSLKTELKKLKVSNKGKKLKSIQEEQPIEDEKDETLIEDEVKEVKKKKPSKVSELLELLETDQAFKAIKDKYSASASASDEMDKVKDSLISYLVDTHHMNLRQVKSVLKNLFKNN